MAKSDSMDTNEQGDAGAGAPFFSLNAHYLIAPGASLEQLLNDCNCLLENGTGSFEATANENDSPASWSGVYMLNQAAAVLHEITRRVLAGESIERRQS